MSVLRVTLFLWLVLAAATGLSAGTGTDVVVHQGREFTQDQAEPYDWPEGALEIANDPLRSWGHLVWSTGAPNDRVQFVLGVREAADLQRHVDRMKNVKSLKRQIVLVPGHLPLNPGYGPPDAEEGRSGVVFELGSQKVIYEWYDRLPEVCPGCGDSEIANCNVLPRRTRRRW